MNLNQTNADIVRPKIMTTKNLSLSSFFPAGTRFFYAYPAGEDSGFLNRVAPPSEELVAARALCCSGPDVFPVVFSATTAPTLSSELLRAVGVPQLESKQTIILPSTIDISLEGAARNNAIKHALQDVVRPGSLVMAQPYTEDAVASLFEIPPAITTWLNDKNNMPDYIDESMLPARYGAYQSGADFASVYKRISLPVVVKVTSSSSGDGVYICHTTDDMQKAAEALQSVVGSVLVEQYIEAQRNYGVHFGIPFLPNRPITLLGINQQLTTSAGEFVGGTIDSHTIPAELLPAIEHLLQDILPHVRAKGWYGVGGFDVLVDRAGKQYFIDCNFRMTGMSAYHFLVANDIVATPMVSFSGEFHGSQVDFERQILPLVSPESTERFAHIIALSCHGTIWRCNGALSFSGPDQMKNHAQTLLDNGLESAALRQLIEA